MRLNQKDKKLFDIVNWETKAFVFLNFTDQPETIIDIRDKIDEQYPHLARPITKQNIYTSLTKVLASKNLGILLESSVKSLRKGMAKAWKLSSLGKRLQPMVAYGVSYLPINHDIPTSSVLGPMNSSNEKRGTYGRIMLLSELFHAPCSRQELQNAVRLDAAKVDRKINHLIDITDKYGKDKSLLSQVEDGKYELTSVGKDFTGNCLIELKYANSGVQSSLELIMSNQPTTKQLTYVMNLFQVCKD